jgi:hypothetical protein
MAENLTESQNWGATKEALMEGLDGQRKQTMNVILENTKSYLAEAATAGATQAGNVAALNKVILPVIRRVMPTVIANELIGVQPMTGPVGQIHTLRVRYADAHTNSAGNNTTAGEEALSPFKIAAGYSSGTPNTADDKAAYTAAQEGLAGNKLSIQIIKEVVEAKSRRLSARWTFEAAQDAQAMHGLDVEAEILAALAQEITTEIDQEILASLRSLAGQDAVYNQSGTFTGTPHYVGDRHAVLAIQMNEQANLVAARTRRGAANWAVVSPSVLTALQSATTSAFARTTEGTFEAPTNVKFVGTLNGTMRVYVDTYYSDAGSGADILLGYKGSTETDAAAFYCPYVPLMSSGVVMDPGTFEPVVSFLTRYGYKELTNTANSFGNAGDYVSGISVSNLSFL